MRTTGAGGSEQRRATSSEPQEANTCPSPVFPWKETLSSHPLDTLAAVLLENDATRRYLNPKLPRNLPLKAACLTGRVVTFHPRRQSVRRFGEMISQANQRKQPVQVASVEVTGRDSEVFH